MENIWDIFNFIRFVADKAINSTPTPEETATALDAAQTLYYKLMFERKEAGDDKANTTLAPFRVSTTLTSNNTGYVVEPSNYANIEGMYGIIGGVFTEYNLIMDTELEYALWSRMRPIARNPRYREIPGGFQLYNSRTFPQNQATVDLNYLKIADKPVIGYTVSGNTLVYDPLTSTQLTFGRNQYVNIITLALPYIGVHLSDNEIIGLTAQAVGFINKEQP